MTFYRYAEQEPPADMPMLVWAYLQRLRDNGWPAMLEIQTPPGGSGAGRMTFYSVYAEEQPPCGNQLYVQWAIYRSDTDVDMRRVVATARDGDGKVVLLKSRHELDRQVARLCATGGPHPPTRRVRLRSGALITIAEDFPFDMSLLRTVDQYRIGFIELDSARATSRDAADGCECPNAVVYVNDNRVYDHREGCPQQDAQVYPA